MRRILANKYWHEEKSREKFADLKADIKELKRKMDLLMIEESKITREGLQSRAKPD